MGCALALVISSGSSSSFAADKGFWYLGGTVGYMSTGVERSRFSDPRPSCTGTSLNPNKPFVGCVVDESDGSGSYSLFAGYQVTDWLGVELAYADLPGTYDINVTDPRISQPTLFDVEQDSRAFSLRGVATLPLSRALEHDMWKPISVSGTFGVTYWRSSITFISDLRGTPGLERRQLDNVDTGKTMTLGARVNYDVNEQVRLMGTWDFYNDVGRSSSATAVPTAQTLPTEVRTVEGSINVFSVGLSYRFH